MAKKAKRPISKDGFVMYARDIDACIEDLNLEERGQLFTVISQYVNGQEMDKPPRVIKMAFNIIKKGILSNEEKYEKRQAALKKYYDDKNAKNAKNAEIVKNLLGNGNGDGNGIGNGVGNGNGISNGNGNGNEENNNNSLSTEGKKIKYSLEEVKKILEEREIFLKQNYLLDFYLLNSNTFKWKYDPYSAFCVWIKNPLHKDALKKSENKQENPPQYSAAPPNQQAAQDMMRHYTQKGEEIWEELYKELLTALPPDILDIVNGKQRVLAASVGYNSGYEMRIDFPDSAHEDVVSRLDRCAEFQAAMKRHKIKRLKYCFTQMKAA